MDLQNYKMNSHNELGLQKVEESNLWDYPNIHDVEVLELNGFDSFKMDSRVF